MLLLGSPVQKYKSNVRLDIFFLLGMFSIEKKIHKKKNKQEDAVAFYLEL
jgi:hypothetical protein